MNAPRLPTSTGTPDAGPSGPSGTVAGPTAVAANPTTATPTPTDVTARSSYDQKVDAHAEFLGTRPRVRTLFEITCYSLAHKLMAALGVTDRHKQYVGTMVVGSTMVKAVDTVADLTALGERIAQQGLAAVVRRSVGEIAAEPLTFGFKGAMAAGFGLGKVTEWVLPASLHDTTPGTVLVTGGTLAPLFNKSLRVAPLRVVGSVAFAGELLNIGAWGLNSWTYGDDKDAAGDFAALVSASYHKTHWSILGTLGIATDMRDLVLAGDVPGLSWVGDLESGPFGPAALRDEWHDRRRIGAGERYTVLMAELTHDAVHEAIGATPTPEQLGKAMAGGWLADQRLPSYARKYDHSREAWYQKNIWDLQKLRLEDASVATFIGRFAESFLTAGVHDLAEGADIVLDALLPADAQAKVALQKSVLVYRELITREAAGASLKPPRAGVAWSELDVVPSDFLSQAKAHRFLDGQGRIIQSEAYFVALKELGKVADAGDAVLGQQLIGWGRGRAEALVDRQGTPEERQRWLSDLAVMQPFVFPDNGDAQSRFVTDALQQARASAALHPAAAATLRATVAELEQMVADSLAQVVQVRMLQGMSIDVAYAAVANEMRVATERDALGVANVQATERGETDVADRLRAEWGALPHSDPMLQGLPFLARTMARMEAIRVNSSAGAMSVFYNTVTAGKVQMLVEPVLARQQKNRALELRFAQPVGEPDPNVGPVEVHTAHRKTALELAGGILDTVHQQWNPQLYATWAGMIGAGTLGQFAGTDASHAQEAAAVTAMAPDFVWQPTLADQARISRYAQEFVAADGANTHLPQLFPVLGRTGKVVDTAPLLAQLWGRCMGNGGVQMRGQLVTALDARLGEVRRRKAGLTQGTPEWTALNAEALRIRRFVHFVRNGVGFPANLKFPSLDAAPATAPALASASR